MDIKKVGIVGCGLMGKGIAQVCATAGYDVMMQDVDEKTVHNAMSDIYYSLMKQANKGKITMSDVSTATSRIHYIDADNNIRDCDIIIEAVPESLELKQRIIKQLSIDASLHTILATNTSSLSVIDIASVARRPEKVVGLHFFYPAPVMKLVEVVKTVRTSDETMNDTLAFCKSIGKTAIVAPDTTGFIVNRVWIAYMLDCIRLLDQGLATREDIDAAMTDGLNYPMGPLKLADVTGLDLLLKVSGAMYEETKDQRYVAPVILKKMVAAGWYGRKTGKGFYDYK